MLHLLIQLLIPSAYHPINFSAPRIYCFVLSNTHSSASLNHLVWPSLFIFSLYICNSSKIIIFLMAIKNETFIRDFITVILEVQDGYISSMLQWVLFTSYGHFKNIYLQFIIQKTYSSSENTKEKSKTVFCLP